MGIFAHFLFVDGGFVGARHGESVEGHARCGQSRGVATGNGTMTRKEQELEALLAPTARALGCELWGLEYRPWGRGRSTLRVFIDSERGVTIDDCERVSAQVSALLDVENPIVDSYRLEVSSPGLDRTLFRREQYQASVGCRIDVRLTFPFAGRRRFAGLLAGVEGDDIVLRVEEESEEYLLPFDQIQRTRIVPHFDDDPRERACGGFTG